MNEAIYRKIIPDGWKLKPRKQKARLTIDNIKNLKPVEFLQRNEEYLFEEDFLERALILNANFGFQDLRFVYEHQGLIPEIFKGVFTFFTDVIVGAGPMVAFLLFDSNKRWRVDYKYLNRPFLGGDRLLRLDNPKK